MNKPNAILFNYQALIIRPSSSPNMITALVDHGFRSWSMRQFRLSGVAITDPRSKKGDERAKIKEDNLAACKILNKIISPAPNSKINILLCPEKPAFSGHFSANIFLPIVNKTENYCTNYASNNYLDINTFMKAVCNGELTVNDAMSFLDFCKPFSFTR